MENPWFPVDFPLNSGGESSHRLARKDQQRLREGHPSLGEWKRHGWKRVFHHMEKWWFSMRFNHYWKVEIYPLVNSHITMARSSMLLMGKSTISMVVFHSYVKFIICKQYHPQFLIRFIELRMFFLFQLIWIRIDKYQLIIVNPELISSMSYPYTIPNWPCCARWTAREVWATAWVKHLKRRRADWALEDQGRQVGAGDRDTIKIPSSYLT